MERPFSIPFGNKWLNKFNYTLSWFLLRTRTITRQIIIIKKKTSRHKIAKRIRGGGGLGILDYVFIRCWLSFIINVLNMFRKIFFSIILVVVQYFGDLPFRFRYSSNYYLGIWCARVYEWTNSSILFMNYNIRFFKLKVWARHSLL